MTNEETVYVMMTSGSLRAAEAWVVKATILDAENNVVREDSGRTRVLEDFERAFPSQAQAWEAAADELLALASRVRARAEDCIQRAAASRIISVPA